VLVVTLFFNWKAKRMQPNLLRTDKKHISIAFFRNPFKKNAAETVDIIPSILDKEVPTVRKVV
jgi:hypothetical protein